MFLSTFLSEYTNTRIVAVGQRLVLNYFLGTGSQSRPNSFLVVME